MGELKDELVEKVVVKEDRERDRWLKKIEGGEGTVLPSLRLLGDRLEEIEGMIKVVGREFTHKGNRKEERERDEEVLRRLRMGDGESTGDEDSGKEEEVEKVEVKSVLTEKFIFEPKGKKVDIGASPPSPRGDLSFSWS